MISDRASAVRTDLSAILAGTAVAVSVAGIALTLTDAQSPLRAPFVLFFLFTGPAGGLTAALPRLEPAARATAAVAGALVVDLLIALTVSPLHVLTTGGGITAVAAITTLLFLRALVLRMRNPEGAGPVDRLPKLIKRIRSRRFRT